MSCPVPELPIPPTTATDVVPETEPVPETERAPHPPTFSPAQVVRRLRSEVGIEGEMSKLERDSADAMSEVLERLQRERDAAEALSLEEAEDAVGIAWLKMQRATMHLKHARNRGQLRRSEIGDLVSEVNNAAAVILVHADRMGSK